MTKRSWPAIIMSILETTLRPANKMRIMHKSYLNFERFDTYFHDLLRKGFLEETNDGNGRALYRATERGRELLEVLRQAEELVASEA